MLDKEHYMAQVGENRFYIYIHRRASDNKPFYVGKGSGKRAWFFCNRSEYWKRIRKKHGVVVDIVFDDLDEDTAFQCEKDTILELKYFGYDLCNMTEGGDGASFVMTEESKQKISVSRINSDAVKADAASRKGQKRSQEICDKIGAGRRGKLVGEEGRKNMSEAQKNRPACQENLKKLHEHLRGKPLSEQHKKKISESSKGRIVSEEQGRKISDSKRDKNVYVFLEIHTGEKFIGTRRELASWLFIPLTRVACIFRAYQKDQACKNWKLLGKVEEL